MPNIKVSDSVYERLKTEAEGNFRTIGGQIEFLINYYSSGSTPTGEKIVPENTPSQKNTEQKNFSATPSNIDDLIKQAPEYDPEIAKKQLSGEMNCCQNERPCKHWVWDSSTGEGYKNTLSGRFREAA